MEQIIAYLQARLRETQGREMFSKEEVQDWFLDLLLLCETPIPAEVG